MKRLRTIAALPFAVLAVLFYLLMMASGWAAAAVDGGEL